MGRRSIAIFAGILGAAAMSSASAQGVPAAPAGVVPKGGPSIRDAGLGPSRADVKYASASRTQVLDIYLPASKAGLAPAVIYAHPGGFRFGDKSMASASISKAILEHGFAFVPVNYRLSGEARFPAAVQDLFAAIEYVKVHGAALGIDPKRIVVFGESAGANLAALAGTAYDAPLFRKALADPASELRPQGVIALYPPVDFLQIDSMLVAQGCAPKTATHNNKDGMESAYLGAALKDVPDLVRQANPVTYASARSSPFLLENGTRDCNVGNGQARLLADALRKAGAKVDYRIIEGAGHGGEPFETAGNIARIIRFLDEAIRPARR